MSDAPWIFTTRSRMRANAFHTIDAARSTWITPVTYNPVADQYSYSFTLDANA